MKMLTRICSALLMSMLVVFCFAGLAQEVSIPVISNDDFFAFLIQSLGGIKGASALVIAGICVQVLLKFISTPLFGSIFKSLKGSVKLTIVLVLSLAAGVIGLMTTSGMSLSAALLHSSTLTAFMVLFNQMYKQYFVKNE